MTQQETDNIDEVLRFLELQTDDQIEVTLSDNSTVVGVVETPGILFESNGFGGTLAATPAAIKINAGAEGRYLVPWRSIISIKYAS